MNLNNKLFETPVLLLIFNRLDTTKEVFNRIKMIRPRYLYIASDGPRHSKLNEDKVVNEVREWVLENIDWDCNLQTLFREKNLGCGMAVSSAISWFFEHVEMGIIIEDDCLVDCSFFKFSEELLIKYKDNVGVTSICSSNTIDFTSMDYSYTFTRYSLIWGWATWRRAWKEYDYNLKSWPVLKKSNWLRTINKSFKFNIYWTHVFDTCYNKKINTWDYQWNYTSFLLNGLSIMPNINLVKNIGIGVNATHKVDEKYSKYFESEINFPLKHPISISTNKSVDEKLQNKVFSLKYIDYLILFIKKMLYYANIKKA